MCPLDTGAPNFTALSQNFSVGHRQMDVLTRGHLLGNSFVNNTQQDTVRI